MENNFQQEIISEISKYQRIISCIELSVITQFCDMPDDEPLEPQHIREFNVNSKKSVTHYFDKINMLRNEYETVTGKVCPV